MRLPRTRIGTALLLAAALTAGACGDDELDRKGSAQPQGAVLRITLGTQEFPEARILGELWRQALAVNGYTVNLRKRVGPAADLDKALRDGAIDGHVAYTGTVPSIVACEETRWPKTGTRSRESPTSSPSSLGSARSAATATGPGPRIASARRRRRGSRRPTSSPGAATW